METWIPIGIIILIETWIPIGIIILIEITDLLKTEAEEDKKLNIC